MVFVIKTTERGNNTKNYKASGNYQYSAISKFFVFIYNSLYLPDSVDPQSDCVERTD